MSADNSSVRILKKLLKPNKDLCYTMYLCIFFLESIVLFPFEYGLNSSKKDWTCLLRHKCWRLHFHITRHLGELLYSTCRYMECFFHSEKNVIAATINYINGDKGDFIFASKILVPLVCHLQFSCTQREIKTCKFTSREPHFIVSKLETLSFVLLANESGSIKDKQYENIKNFYNIKLTVRFLKMKIIITKRRVTMIRTRSPLSHGRASAR